MSAPAGRRLLRRVVSKQHENAFRPMYKSQMAASLPRSPVYIANSSSPRFFSKSPDFRAGMMPDTPDPKPPHNAAEDNAHQSTAISDEEYTERADEYMNAIHEKAEQLQETREDVEVEYSAGVLSITFPPNGTYIINKQPPNKQIWLSSPISGPKRYDWVLTGESMHHKEGGGDGHWIYQRDGSSLTKLLSNELGISLISIEEHSKQSTDPTE